MTRGSTILLRLWGALLIAAALVMGPLPIFTFGLMAFGALFVLWLRGGRRRPGAWAEAPPEGDTWEAAHAHWVNGAVLLLCAVWFLLNIWVEIARVVETGDPDRLMVLLMAIAFVFPPLIMHGSYLESSGEARTAGKAMLAGVYALALAASTLLFLRAARIVEGPAWIMFPAAPLLLVALITAAAVTGARLSPRDAATRPAEAPRGPRSWPYILGGGAAALMLIVSVVIMGRLPGYAERLSVLMRSLPVLMLFMASYYERRFEFFDVFVKKSTLFFVLLLLLFAYFSLLPAWLEVRIPEAMRVWILSLTLLPLVFAIPWLSGRIERWLDRVWLGRRHTTAEAVGAYLDGFAEVSTERQLLAHTESRLSEVFQAPVRIVLAAQPQRLGLSGRAASEDGLGQDVEPAAAELEVVEMVAIPGHGHPGGEIRMGPRVQQTPYFRQDLTLLHALAKAFSYMLANLRLRERRQAQDKREQELILLASRAELKALRAQINPHFLFNALNTIASLIAVDPEHAEATVEQLAEVFRYTLRRSEAEWARVEDEIDFVRSYLEVEKARFGDRLQVSIEIEPEVRDARIPAMMVQTLVENAVKHGLGAVKRQGRLAIEAGRRGDRIEIRVGDNGPRPQGGRPKAAAGPEHKAAGYGLENIRRRLAGYYRDSASVDLTRDDAEGITLATLRLPLAASREAERGRHQTGGGR